MGSVTVQEKVCNRCNVLKPADQFYRDKKMKDNLFAYCKVCNIAATLGWIKGHPDEAKTTRTAWLQTAQGKAWKKRWSDKTAKSGRRRERNLAQHGITLEQYAQMAQDQGDRCKICRRTADTSFKGVLAVDHSHATGVVRGLLCHRCNLALGGFQDSTDILEAAILYLKAS